jgi:hypothetical protein
MFSNEFLSDCTVTTILDETGEYEDTQVIIGDDCVYIRQFPEDDRKPADLICLTPKMFYDMITALEHTEGFFQTRYKKK